MRIEDTIKISELLNLYGELLSKKQKTMLENYVNRDMSLAEIAENENISRDAVLDAIKKAKQKLFYYEKILKLYKLKTDLRQVLTCDTKDYKSKITKILEDL